METTIRRAIIVGGGIGGLCCAIGFHQAGIESIVYEQAGSVILARSLGRVNDLPAAVRRYEAERMPRTAWVTDQSWRIGRLAQLENPFACKIRDFVMKHTPSTLVMKTLEKAVGYEL